MKLYKHNLEALNKISEAFEKYDKVAYITATGTGKSYVSAAYLQQELDKNHKRILIITPRISLNDYWKNILNKMNKSIDLITYHKMSRFDDNDIMNITQYSMIIFDEIHHMGARVWGQKIKRIYKAIDDSKILVKVLGLSADAYRYDLDRNMAEEYFDTTVYGLSVEEGVDTGVLNKFKYVTVAYKLKESIDSIKNKLSYKKKLRAEDPVHTLIDKLDKDASKYDIRKIVLKHLPKNTNNKVIVFVDSISAIYEEIARFEKLFPKADFLSIHSNNTKKVNAEILKEFHENKNKLCFIFSVGMLNEGLHIDDVNGIILLRKTESRTLYMQQLGRILSSNRNIVTVVFDFVSNYMNMPISQLISINEGNGNYNPGYSDSEAFQFICDYETKSIFDIFYRIYTNINNRWTKEQDDILIKNYEKEGPVKVSELLDGAKTPKQCVVRAHFFEIKYRTGWTKEQDDILIKNYEKEGPTKVSELLDGAKTPKQCRTRAGKYEISCIEKWTKEQDDILIKNYEKEGPTKVSQLLKGAKTPEQCSSRAKKYKMKYIVEWTKEQDDILIKNYEKEGPTKVSQLLKGAKTPEQCTTRARFFEIKYKAVWTKEQDDILIKNYEKEGPTKVSELLDGAKTPEQCRTRALEKYEIKYRTGWTKEQDNILIKNYEKIGGIGVSELLDGAKTPQQCRARAKKYSIKKLNNKEDF